jgi:uncharacterized protein
MASETLRGRFLWHELMSSDTGSAAAFYGKVIGWKAQSWEGDVNYSMWIAPTGSVGGLMALPAEAAAMGALPSWLLYIGTPNVDATVSDAGRLGARILKGATEIPNVGRFAVVADPQGATFAAFTPSSEMGPPGTPPEPKLGEFAWHELATTDRQGAFGFYRDLFGWEKTGAVDMGPMGEYLLFGKAGKGVGGMYDKPKDVQAPPHWLCYVRVDDAASVAARVARSGGRLLHGPAQVPGGDWIAQLLDPQGAAIAVVSTPKGAVARKPGRPKKSTGKKKVRPAAKKAPRRKAARKKVSARKAPARRAAPRKAARTAARGVRRARGGKRRR